MAIDRAFNTLKYIENNDNNNNKNNDYSISINDGDAPVVSAGLLRSSRLTAAQDDSTDGQFTQDICA